MVAMLIFPLNHFLLVQLTLVSSMKNTLKYLELVSNHNRPFLLDFLEYMREKGKVGIGSGQHASSVLSLMIAFDKFFKGKSFTKTYNKQEILTFLDHKYIIKEDGWVKRKHDNEGRWINTYNQYVGLLKVFFRWLVNRHKDKENWDYPRDSPYGITDIWA